MAFLLFHPATALAAPKKRGRPISVALKWPFGDDSSCNDLSLLHFLAYGSSIVSINIYLFSSFCVIPAMQLFSVPFGTIDLHVSWWFLCQIPWKITMTSAFWWVKSAWNRPNISRSSLGALPPGRGADLEMEQNERLVMVMFMTISWV